MITVLSPSKNMDIGPVDLADATQPAFLERSERLIERMRRFSVSELMEFMDISEKLAELNCRRFAEWQLPFTTKNARQALLAFSGDVYEGLDASRLETPDIHYAQNHLRILSGLYGLLRPLDLIQPYRLEMGRPLQTEEAENLYRFWRETITEALNAQKGSVLVNLASQEYFKAIDTLTLEKDVITPVFKDKKNGTYKVISFFAKKARGRMARYMITNRIEDIDGIRSFAEDGYTYNSSLSSPTEPVFTRSE